MSLGFIRIITFVGWSAKYRRKPTLLFNKVFHLSGNQQSKNSLIMIGILKENRNAGIEIKC